MTIRRAVSAAALLGVRALFLVSTLGVFPGAVSAQAPFPAIGVSLDTTPRRQVDFGKPVTIPVRLELEDAGSLKLASLQLRVRWAPERMVFDSLRLDPAADAAQVNLTANESSVASGTLLFNVFKAEAITISGTLARLYFTSAASGPGGTAVSVEVEAAGDESASSIVPSVRATPFAVCVAPIGKWGDANADGVVSIIDAQQIARYSVQLSVANVEAVEGRGDVTADNVVNILDAQQIARFSVQLSTSPRTGTNRYTPPSIAALTTVPGPSLTMVERTFRTLYATPESSDGTDLTGCLETTWSSSNASVATVSSAGVLTALVPGSSTVTVSAGGQTTELPVTVIPPYEARVVTQPAGAVNSEFFTTQPVVEVLDVNGVRITDQTFSITARVASGSGTLNGTTTVSTVNGVASFTNLAINGTGSHSLEFTVVNAAPVTSSAFTVAVPSSMRVLVGETPSITGVVSTDVVVPLQVDLSGRGSNDVASLTVVVTWDPAKLSYVGNTGGNWTDANGDPASLTINASQVATGSFRITGFTNEATLTSFLLRNLTLKPLAAGATTVSALIDAAGNVGGGNVTVTARDLAILIAP